LIYEWEEKRWLIKILYQIADRITTITINRPKSLNALNYKTMGELKEAFVRAQEDPDAKLVMITGMGEKAFIAVADLNELALLSPISRKEVVLGGHETETGHSSSTISQPILLCKCFTVEQRTSNPKEGS
jgi:enoyl-CoA hydratase